MPFHRLAAAFVLTGAFIGGSAACGNSDATNPDFGSPPDPSKFNPGSGSDDPYGYNNVKTGPSMAECPAELKRCSQTFTFPFNNETSVEVRGDFGGQDTWDTGVPMKHDGALWTAEVPVPLATPVQYKFFKTPGGWTTDPNQPSATDATGSTNNTFAGKTCDPTTCEEQGVLPPGVFDWRDSVIYFTFVDRFNNADMGNDCHVAGVSGVASDYQGGDWKGVTAKIKDGYFSTLGVNTLWVTVPFDNPNTLGRGTAGDTHEYSGYHGYWPLLKDGDPTVLTPETCFGTLADLQELVASAHAGGLKVLLDFAMVHAFKNDEPTNLFNKHPDWFWENSKGGSPDCVCGGSYCTWEADYQRCWFADYLPHWNYTVPAAREWSVANAVAWIKQTQDAAGQGVDGFRADAIKHVDVSWLNALRAKIKTDITATQTPPQRFYMVGETFEWTDTKFIKSFIDPSTKLDGQFDFPLRAHVVQAMLMGTEKMSDLAAFMNTNDYFYGSKAVMSTFIGNHDLPRAIHLAHHPLPWSDQGANGQDCSNNQPCGWEHLPSAPSELEAYERMANGYAVLFTNRGAPLVYYGDEFGMPGASDPDNRRFMQWTGYTSNQMYLHDRLKLLADIRSKHPALRRGTRSTIDSDSDTWIFMQQTTGDTVYVAINRGDAPKEITGLPAGPLDDLVSLTTANGPTVTVPARQTRIFVAK